MVRCTVEASVHVGLALERAQALATEAPSKDLTQLGGYLTHANSVLNVLDESLRKRMALLNGPIDGGSA